MQTYDAIVLGTGGVGSAALWHLARKGGRVLGLDRFQPPHDRGSSHGQTRIIRQAYFEHSNYTPLLIEAYRLWSELESQVGKQLYAEVGLLEVGPVDGIVVPGVLRSAAEHHLEVEQLTAGMIETRWPDLSVPSEYEGVFEKRAGYLLVEECVRSHLQAAQQAGAELLHSVEVLGWDAGELIRLRTSAGEFATARLVVTAGAWAGPLFADLDLHLKVRRTCLFWYATKDDRYAAHSGFPSFLFELPTGIFYGFPQIDDRGLKVAEHSGGELVEDPLHVDRELHPDDRRKIDVFLQKHFSQATLQQTDQAVCMYTMTPDEHFVVDRHPTCPQIVFAAGLSGHGFKFASVLGKALAEMAIDGGTDLPIGFLGLARGKSS